MLHPQFGSVFKWFWNLGSCVLIILNRCLSSFSLHRCNLVFVIQVFAVHVILYHCNTFKFKHTSNGCAHRCIFQDSSLGTCVATEDKLVARSSAASAVGGVLSSIPMTSNSTSPCGSDGKVYFKILSTHPATTKSISYGRGCLTILFPF
jgi:hypothetical protein